MKKLTLLLLSAGLMVPAWAEDPKPEAEPSPIEEAVQKFKEGEAKNSQEMAAEFQELQQSAQVVGEKVKKVLTPFAKRLKKQAEAEAPAIIEAAAEQSRANSKLVTSFLSALKHAADGVAEEIAK